MLRGSAAAHATAAAARMCLMCFAVPSRWHHWTSDCDFLPTLPRRSSIDMQLSRIADGNAGGAGGVSVVCHALY